MTAGIQSPAQPTQMGDQPGQARQAAQRATARNSTRIIAPVLGAVDLPPTEELAFIGGIGLLAVVGVLMKTGKPNAAFSRIVSTMPAKEGPAVKADARINPNALLPAKRGYYRYSGSLTTPPCAETVEWLLLTDPIQVAEADVASFAKLYPMNARPVQKDNRRYVLQSS